MTNNLLLFFFACHDPLIRHQSQKQIRLRSLPRKALTLPQGSGRHSPASLGQSQRPDQDEARHQVVAAAALGARRFRGGASDLLVTDGPMAEARRYSSAAKLTLRAFQSPSPMSLALSRLVETLSSANDTVRYFQVMSPRPGTSHVQRNGLPLGHTTLCGPLPA